MDHEEGLHRLARLWFPVHQLAAWLLFVLVVVHIWSSLRYGGF
jgi:hypothetical protein